MSIYSFLKENNIEYRRYDHEAVFTVEESDRLNANVPGAKTKNLFLRDKKGRRHFLVVVPGEKRADLDALALVLGTTRLSFGSAERLKSYLDLEPGSVSILGVVNDHSGVVEVYIDKAVWDEGLVQCHPLVNTATLVISSEGIEKVLELTGHRLSLIDVPAKHSEE